MDEHGINPNHVSGADDNNENVDEQGPEDRESYPSENIHTDKQENDKEHKHKDDDVSESDDEDKHKHKNRDTESEVDE